MAQNFFNSSFGMCKLRLGIYIITELVDHLVQHCLDCTGLYATRSSLIHFASKCQVEGEQLQLRQNGFHLIKYATGILRHYHHQTYTRVSQSKHYIICCSFRASSSSWFMYYTMPGYSCSSVQNSWHLASLWQDLNFFSKFFIYHTCWYMWK